MTPNLKGLKVTVLGGDRREFVLIQALIGTGAVVTAVGYNEELSNKKIQVKDSTIDAIQNADVVIAPMSGADEHGRVKKVPKPSVQITLDEKLFANMQRSSLFLIGMAGSKITNFAQKNSIRLIQLAEVDEIAILNSIPTAEGAIQIAMEKMPITLHGSKTLVLGFGRCGITLARVLHTLGSDTTVVARNLSQLARASEMNMRTQEWGQLQNAVKGKDCIFNTVPAPVLSSKILDFVDKDCIIIDIASAPGGTDFKKAKELGLEARLELGLPGKVAPLTAGKILAEHIPRIIAGHCL